MITQYPAKEIRSLESGVEFTIAGLALYFWPTGKTFVPSSRLSLVRRIVKQCEEEGLVERTGRKQGLADYWRVK